jgi:hypothetical protein
MEMVTPPSPVASGGAAANAAAEWTEATAALIVRMPDSGLYRGVRRWIDRMEVDEMVERERAGRSRTRSTAVVQYTDPAGVMKLRDGMDLYFVGHGSPNGFLGSHNLDEGYLVSWIRERVPPGQVVRLRKIKLVTCNAGTPDISNIHEPRESFASRLADRLKGIVTGKVVAFAAYIVSTPDLKATYRKEPPSADLGAQDVQRRLSEAEAKIRRGIAKEFARILMQPDRSVSAVGVAWAEQVILKNKAQFDAILKNVANKFFRGVDDFAQALESGKSGICWPGSKSDLEEMVAGMKERNARANSELKAHADRLFTEWQNQITELARAEWTNRKHRIAAAYHAEGQYERKTPGQKMRARVEREIPPA